MKVLLVNGSPHAAGCTYTALMEVGNTLSQEGIEAEVFQIGIAPMSGCIACQRCNGKGRCFIDDPINEFLVLAEQADGFVFGSPVHYAAAGGAMTAFMDRAFYAGSRSANKPFYLKPAAAVIAARRAGTTAAFEQLNKYFTISEMPVVSSCYWNMVHGARPEEVKEDAEGLQTMRVLARNMAWLLKCKEAGAKAGVPLPEREKRVFTNFILPQP